MYARGLRLAASVVFLLAAILVSIRGTWFTVPKPGELGFSCAPIDPANVFAFVVGLATSLILGYFSSSVPRWVAWMSLACLAGSAIFHLWYWSLFSLIEHSLPSALWHGLGYSAPIWVAALLVLLGAFFRNARVRRRVFWMALAATVTVVCASWSFVSFRTMNC